MLRLLRRKVEFCLPKILIRILGRMNLLKQLNQTNYYLKNKNFQIKKLSIMKSCDPERIQNYCRPSHVKVSRVYFYSSFFLFDIYQNVAPIFF